MGFKVANVTHVSGERIGGTLSFDHRILELYESRGVVGFRGAVWSTMW